MNYEEALQYIEQLNTRGIALGLERISCLLELLDNPQEALRCIHVAGTNGKGSVCAFMDCALRQAGLRVGRYISPTLYDYLERFQINGTYIAEQQFADLLGEVRKACDQMAQMGQETPTVFEVETAVAFLYFKQQNCDYVLLEVGMGGRLDSTNMINKPVCSVITSIGLDHTGMLGDSLAEIAAEKAGIMKPGCPVVLAPQPAEAMAVLQAKAECCGVVPTVVNVQLLQNSRWSIDGQQFSYGKWNDLTIGLLGTYQMINAAVALEALQVLQRREDVLPDTAIISGLAQTKWPGRFELIHMNPVVIVDGAHNPAGAQALADTLKQVKKELPDSNIQLLMGVFRDKDYIQIGHIMSDYGDTLICFQPPQERGLPATELAEAMKPYYREIIVKETAADAVQYVLADAAKNDIIVSFGSLSTIKAVQDAVMQWEVHHGE